MLGEKQLLDCQYGVHYKKPKSNTSNRIYLQGTRKKGCPAHIEITQFDLYPEYSVHSHMCTNISQKQAREIREESLKSLKQALKQQRCGGYSQILHKPAHRGSPPQMPSYIGDNGAFTESAPRACS